MKDVLTAIALYVFFYLSAYVIFSLVIWIINKLIGEKL